MERRLKVGDEEYVVERDGDDLRVGRAAGGETRWFDETVPVSTLPEGARQALESDGDDAALAEALSGIVTGFSHRGG